MYKILTILGVIGVSILGFFGLSKPVTESKLGATSCLIGQQGGTGQCTATTTDAGKALIVSSTNPLIYTFGTVGSTGVSTTTVNNWTALQNFNGGATWTNATGTNLNLTNLTISGVCSGCGSGGGAGGVNTSTAGFVAVYFNGTSVTGTQTISLVSSTITTGNLTTANIGTLNLNNSAFTSLLGTGLQNSAGSLALGATYQDGSAYDARFVNTSGDTMTGALTVPNETVGAVTITSSANFTGASVSGFSSANLSDVATLAKLASNQTFTGLNIFSATTTFTTTTQVSSTINTANILNLNAFGPVNFTGASIAGLSIGQLTGSTTIAYLANNQTFTGLNTFSATTTFATTTHASSTINTANVGTLNLATFNFNGSAFTSLLGTGLQNSAGSLALGPTYQDGSAYDSRFVNTTGDTMTGALTAPSSTIGNLTVTSTLNVTGAVISGLSTANLSDAATLAKLASNQTFTGLNIFSATTTLATTTISSTTINNANITTLTVGSCTGCGTGGGGVSTTSTNTWTALNTFNGGLAWDFATGASTTIGRLTVTSTVNFTGATISGLNVNQLTGSTTIAYLANNQTFTGLNIFSATTTFATTTMTSSTITSLNLTNLVLTGALTLPNNSITDAMVVAGLTISGGSVDNSPIGASVASTGIFTNATSTNLSVTNTSTLSGNVILGAGQQINRTAISALTYSILATDYWISMSTTNALTTTTLPAAAAACPGGKSREYKIYDRTGNANRNNIVIIGTGSDKINNVTSTRINSINGWRTLVSDCSSNWETIGQ